MTARFVAALTRSPKRQQKRTTFEGAGGRMPAQSRRACRSGLVVRANGRQVQVDRADPRLEGCCGLVFAEVERGELAVASTWRGSRRPVSPTGCWRSASVQPAP
jgi:hypothetical protein